MNSSDLSPSRTLLEVKGHFGRLTRVWASKAACLQKAQGTTSTLQNGRTLNLNFSMIDICWWELSYVF